MNQWQQVTALLKKWGWSVQFAWWGQTHKTDPDIDELENLSSISYITPDEFFKLSDPAPSKKKSSRNRNPAGSNGLRLSGERIARLAMPSRPLPNGASGTSQGRIPSVFTKLVLVVAKLLD
jgi:hypothetical protein